MPIEEVRQLLQAPDEASRNRAILVHLERMHRQLDETRGAVASLQALLSEGPGRAARVEIRRLPATQAVVARGDVAFDDCADWPPRRWTACGRGRRPRSHRGRARTRRCTRARSSRPGWARSPRSCRWWATGRKRSTCPPPPRPCSSTMVPSPTWTGPTGLGATWWPRWAWCRAHPGVPQRHQHRGVLAGGGRARVSDRAGHRTPGSRGLRGGGGGGRRAGSGRA